MNVKKKVLFLFCFLVLISFSSAAQVYTPVQELTFSTPSNIFTGYSSSGNQGSNGTGNYLYHTVKYTHMVGKDVSSWPTGGERSVIEGDLWFDFSDGAHPRFETAWYQVGADHGGNGAAYTGRNATYCQFYKSAYYSNIEVAYGTGTVEEFVDTTCSLTTGQFRFNNTFNIETGEVTCSIWGIDNPAQTCSMTTTLSANHRKIFGNQDAGYQIGFNCYESDNNCWLFNVTTSNEYVETSLVNVTLLNPNNNEVNSTNATNFTFTYVTDFSSQYVTTVDFLVNGTSNQVNSSVMLPDVTHGFNISFDANETQDLTWFVQVNVSDGSSYNSSTRTYHFDDSSPIIVINTPVNGSVTFTDNMTVSGTVTDENLHAVNITMFNSSNEVVWNHTEWGVSSPYAFFHEVNLSVKPAGFGNYTLEVDATDEHNKLSERSRIKPVASTSSWDSGSFTLTNNIWDVGFELVTDQEIEDFETSWNDVLKQQSYKLKAKCDGCSDGSNFTLKVKSPGLVYIPDSGYPGHLIKPFAFYSDFYGITYDSIDVDCFDEFCMVEIETEELEWEVNSLGGLNVVTAYANFQSDAVPLLENVTVTNTSVYSNSDLNCSFDVLDYDAPDDNLRVNVTWERNGTNLNSYNVNASSCTSGTTCYTSTVVPAADTSVGDDWSCSVTLYDDHGGVNSTMSVNHTIQSSGTTVSLDFPANIIVSKFSDESSSHFVNFTASGVSDLEGCNFSVVDLDTELGNFTSYNVTDLYIPAGESNSSLVTFTNPSPGAYSADLRLTCNIALEGVTTFDDLVDGAENDITYTSNVRTSPGGGSTGGGGGGGTVDLNRISVSQKSFNINVVIGEATFGNEFDICSEWALPVTVRMRSLHSWLSVSPSQEFTVDKDQCVTVSFSTTGIFTSGVFPGEINVVADESVDEVIDVTVRVEEGDEGSALLAFLSGGREASETEGAVLLVIVGLFVVFSQGGQSVFGGSKSSGLRRGSKSKGLRKR